MFARSILLSFALVPAVAAAQGQPQQAPVTIGNEVELHKPGTPDGGALPALPQGRALRVGVVPSLGQGADVESDKFAKYLSTQLGMKVQPELFENHDAEANALVAGRIDFAWMPPLQAFNAQLGGAQLIVKLTRNGAATYRSVFFVRPDSKFQKLAEVKGARVGWVEANSATGHIFPLAMLEHEKLLPSQLFASQQYLGNHDAVCKAVWSKKVDVGATLADEPKMPNRSIEVDGCKNSLKGDAAKLRIISISEPVPNDVIAVRKGLDANVVAKLRDVALGMPASKDGKAILQGSLKADGVAAVNPGDFDPVARALEAAADVDGK